ncbi:hypothetical protein R3P38DRAFT_2957495 [Favolaschia claudopus]|uniref:F-box domain-containing protein n=1 Tax=Favolaschia claudopus TaxID=2862362 RepID=A0AAW0BBW3_9AGAR
MQAADSPDVLFSQLMQLPTTTFETQAKTLIAASEANIARIESQIRDLERLRDRERGVIARLRMAIAPVNKLPAELLVEIFSLVCCWNWSSFNYGKERVKNVHKLSQVCAYWRRIVHTTPRLFRESLVFRLQKTPDADYLAVTKQWLERSSPYSIPIHLENWGEKWRSVDAGPLMDIMSATAHRWHSATFRLSSLDVLRRIRTVSLPSLRTFDLSSGDNKHHELTRPLLTAPHLKTVTLRTCRTSKFLLPWAQITVLDIDDDDPLECLNALVQCTSVTHATIETPPWKEPPDISQRPMTTLSRLEELTIDFEYHNMRGDLTGPFFAYLSLPALKKLKITMDMGDLWSSADFTEFQRRSPNIEHLTFVGCELDPNDLLAVLQNSPSLVDLDMELCRFCLDDSIILGLQYVPTQTPILAPKLQTLSMSYAGSSFDEDDLDAMDGRAAPPPPSVSPWSKTPARRNHPCYRVIVSAFPKVKCAAECERWGAGK